MVRSLRNFMGTGKKGYLDELTDGGEFGFRTLDLPGIDNEPVIRMNSPEMAEEETCLFHRSVGRGEEYLDRLDGYLTSAIGEHRPAPVVRFADGEYAFYDVTLGCNGLYRQAESVEAIHRAMPLHIDALRMLAAAGKMAPLIFPGNVVRRPKRGILSLLRHSEEPSAASFLDFLHTNAMALTVGNYVPFYIVYAYLTSGAFAHLADGRRLVVLNSDFDPESFRSWFSRFSSRPEILFVRIPDRYVATQWKTLRDRILGQVPSDTDLCLVGAGVGALPVCVDVARHCSIPAVDAGHVLNMMNGREDKSNGMRLYTLWK